MFKEIWDKLSTVEHHHQILFAGIVLVAVVLFSWGVEKIFEEYVFPKRKPIYSYLFAIFLGFAIFMISKSVLLNVM